MKLILAIAFAAFIGTAKAQEIISETGLKYKVLETGTGSQAQEGDEVYIFETTSYRNGTVLYSNYDSANPVKFVIGAKQATDAVNEGVTGMKAGEIRELTAPHYLVKRKAYPVNVSPDSTLVIKVRLQKIVRPK